MKAKVDLLTAELAKESRKILQFEVVHEEIGLCNLPELEVPAIEHRAAFESLYQALDEWETAGSSMPFDWETLTTLTRGGPAPIEMCKGILGDTWSK